MTVLANKEQSEKCPACGAVLVWRRDRQGVLWAMCSLCKYARQIVMHFEIPDWVKLGDSKYP